MSNAELNRKYADTLRKLHTCRPAEKSALQTLLNYYYNLIQNRGYNGH